MCEPANIYAVGALNKGEKIVSLPVKRLFAIGYCNTTRNVVVVQGEILSEEYLQALSNRLAWRVITEKDIIEDVIHYLADLCEGNWRKLSQALQKLGLEQEGGDLIKTCD